MSQENSLVVEAKNRLVDSRTQQLYKGPITGRHYLVYIQEQPGQPISIAYIENEEERTKAIDESEIVSTQIIFTFCQKKMPPRFFDILYKNEDMFKQDYEGDTEFLPHIHFKSLWQFIYLLNKIYF
jgi:hypothetical protein